MFRVVSSTPSRLKIIFGSGKPSLMTFGNLDAHFGLVVDAVFSDDEPPLSSAMATPTRTTPSRTPPTMSGTGLRLRRSSSGGFAGGGGPGGGGPGGGPPAGGGAPATGRCTVTSGRGIGAWRTRVT